MSEIAVSTFGLGKRYRIAGDRLPYRTLRETLVQMSKRPLERIRHPGASSHSSQDFWALRHVDLEVRRGEVLGIIGRNGAGKSTLLKVLSRITEPTEGRAEIRGRVASLLEVGTGFHQELTGRENIYLNGAILGMTRAEIKHKFDEIVEFSEISTFLDTPVKRYSSGMHVRLAFAVAAHLEPETLIVDEVLAVGDAEFQKKCIGKMSDVATGGRTVLFVSHNMAAVEGLCTSAILIRAGQVAARGSVPAVITEYMKDRQDAADESTGVLARSKSGALELKAVRFLDADGELVGGGRCGSDLDVELVVGSNGCMSSAVGIIGINDSFGKRIALLNSRLCSDLNPPLKPGVQSLVCHISRMPLSQGAYSLDIGVEAHGDTGDEVIWAPNCLSLDVTGGDFHGTGRMPSLAWGGVVQISQEWSYNESS